MAEIQVNEFTDETLLTIIAENRQAALSAGDGPEYYPALACALQAQMILEYRRNRAEILSGDAMGKTFDTLIEKTKNLVTPLSSLFGFEVPITPTASEPLESQVRRLSHFILSEVPEEPADDEGAIDTAIRLIRAKYCASVEAPAGFEGAIDTAIRLIRAKYCASVEAPAGFEGGGIKPAAPVHDAVAAAVSDATGSAG